MGHVWKRRSGIALVLAIALALVTGFSVGRHARPEARAQGGAPFGFSDVVFLSHIVSPDMPIWPGDPRPRVKTLFTVKKDGFRLNLLRIASTPARTGARPATSTPVSSAPISSTRRTSSTRRS
jgi:hypothetical protein